MKGDFEFSGSGTFSTSAGPWGAVLIVVAVIVILVLEWIAAHIWWILGGTVGGAAVVVTPLWLMARRYRRAPVSPWVPVGGSQVPLTESGRPAVGAPREIHYHFHGAVPDEVRRALEDGPR